MYKMSSCSLGWGFYLRLFLGQILSFPYSVLLFSWTPLCLMLSPFPFFGETENSLPPKYVFVKIPGIYIRVRLHGKVELTLQIELTLLIS